MTDSDINEKILERLDSLEERISKLESPETQISKRDNTLESKILENIDDIGIQNLVLLALKIKPKQSRPELKEKISSWQKPIGKWFDGSSIKMRLLDTHQIIPDGTNEKKKEVYSLGSKGVRTVKSLIKKYNLS